MSENVDKRQIWESLSDWDNFDQPLAPLNDEQLNSIIELTAFSTNKYFPPCSVSACLSNIPMAEVIN